MPIFRSISEILVVNVHYRPLQKKQQKKQQEEDEDKENEHEDDENQKKTDSKNEHNHNDKDDNNKIRNRIESRTHGILIVQMEKDGMVVTPNKERFDNKDKIMTKEYRKIVRAEEDEQFVKGWFCFKFSEPTKSYPKKERKASEKAQRKLYRRLQKEFKRKVRITEKYLDNVGKADMVNLMESRKENETQKLKRMKIQKQKQKDL